MPERDRRAPRTAAALDHGTAQGGLRRLRAWLCVAAGLLAALAAGAQPAGEAPAQKRFGNDVYMAGGEIAVRTEVPGDAVVAGGRVTVAAPVGGDALVAGGNVSIESSVADDLYAAGGEVRLAGPVGGSARVAGGRVTIAPGTDVAGDMTVAGGRVRLDGHVRGYALVSAGSVEVDGRIDGNLRVVGGELALGPNAVVQGRLDYRGAQPLRMAPGAQVQGGVDEATPKAPEVGVPRGALIFLVASAIVTAAVLLALAPNASRRVTQAMRARPAVSPLLGVVVLVGLPIVVVILMVTVVGIPLGLLAIAALLALIPLGYLAAAAALGDTLVERRGPARTWLRILATALALIVLFALAQLPYVGWLVWFLALLFGIGAIALALFGRRRPPPVRTA